MRMPTQDGLAMIEGFEKRVPYVYADSAGVPTGGIGHTGNDLGAIGTPIPDAKINSWFADDVAEAVEIIEHHVPADVIAAIPSPSYDALVSFVFNVGEQAFVDPNTGAQTHFSKTLNAEKWDEVDDRMRDWVKCKGKRVQGLVNRRAAESAQWNLGFSTMLPENVSKVAAAGVASAVAAPEHSGVVPDAPAKKPALTKKGVTGTVAVLVGAAASNAPQLISSGQQLRSMVGDIKLFSALGASLIAVGVGVMLYEKMRERAKTGA